MLQVSIIGHLGADAEVKVANGKSFVSFNVAHTEKWSGADGVQHEETTWVSCALNGDGGGLLPYLKRGQCVFAQGRASLRVYSSKKARGMVAGCNLSVDRIELYGSAVEDVPRYIYTAEGEQLRTYKAYYIDANANSAILPKNEQVVTLKDQRGGEYNLDKNGYVWPIKSAEGPDDENQ